MQETLFNNNSPITLLTIDAVKDFQLTVNSVPAPGLGGAIGRLNSVRSTIIHVIHQLDSVISIISETEQLSHLGAEIETIDFHKLTVLLNFHSEKIITLCKNITNTKLTQPIEVPHTSIIPPQYGGASCEQLLAWTIAHLFIHTGEISTIAFLMGAQEITLPGKMQASLKNN